MLHPGLEGFKDLLFIDKYLNIFIKIINYIFTIFIRFFVFILITRQIN